MNLAIIQGNLGKDPELRHTQSGKAVASFSVATTEGGGDQKRTTWHRVIAWEKQAEVSAQYLRKGSKVLVQGTISHREYDDKQGVKRQVTEIVARQVTFLDPPRRDAQPSGGDEQYAPQEDRNAVTRTTSSFGGQRAQPPPAAVSEDDIPF